MKSRILFVNPPYRCGVVDVIGRWLPLGLVYLAGSARAAGLDAEIFDAAASNHDFTEIEQRLRQANPSYVAVTALTATLPISLKILALAKRINPRVVTILGGVHATFCAATVLDSTAVVDYLVCGEGEATLAELLTVLETGGDPAGVAGLVFRRDGGLVSTPARPLVQAIDDLPTAWDLLPWQEYSYFVMAGSCLGVVSTSRGGNPADVPSPPEGGDPRRYRDPRRVVAEIVHLHERYGVNVVLLADEYPTGDRGRWESILDLLRERNLPVSLLMQAHSSHVLRDRDILWKYRAAGVVHVYLAGCGETGEEVDGARLAIEGLHAAGMVSETSFVIGAPGETKGNVERIYRLAQRLNPDNAQFLAFTPWPYEPRHGELRGRIRVDDYTRYNLIDPVVEPEQMTLAQVDDAILECYRKFYMGKMVELLTMKDEFRRGYLMRAMKLIMVSPFIIRKMGIGALGRCLPQQWR